MAIGLQGCCGPIIVEGLFSFLQNRSCLINPEVQGYPDYDIDVTVCAFGASEMTAAKAEFDFQIMY